MRRVLDIGVKRGLILELHDAAEGVALSARRNVGAYMGLQKAGDLALESGDFFGRSVFLGLGYIGLPVESKNVKDVAGSVFSHGSFGLAGGGECGNGGGDAAISD